MPPSGMQCAADQTRSMKAVSENSKDAQFLNFVLLGLPETKPVHIQ